MSYSQGSAPLNYKNLKLTLIKICTISLCFALSACDKSQSKTLALENNKIELIQSDIISVNHGTSVSKTAFTGTVQAVNQSNIQAQVTATATEVQVKVGESVAKGQILVRLNNQDNAARLAQAQANLASTQAQANQSLNMMSRKKRLLEQGYISKVDYEQSQLDYRSQMESVRSQQSNVDIAKKAEQDGIIRSPMNGIITKRQIEPGQTVTAGQTIFEIIDPSNLEVSAKLPNDMQEFLKIGQPVEFNIQGNTQNFTGKILRISPIANVSSRQIDFYAVPNESINSLSIGAFVEGNILSSEQISGQIIPLDTIHDINKKPYVWIVRNKKLEKTNIKILEQRYSDNIAIIDGLQTNDVVSRLKFTDQDIKKDVIINKN